jgi:Ser/Thr protein kinase RdoA (MazF antagonist)
MLEAADAALAARDTALPGLAWLLDTELLAEAINQALPDAGLTQFEKHYLRYKPGMNCLAAYRARHAGRTIAFHVKAHGRDAPIKLNKAGQRPSVSVDGLPGRLVLAHLGLVLNFFPNDDKLKRLLKLGDAEQRQALLANLFPEQPALWRGRLETLAYKPERRFVCRVIGDDGSSKVLRFHTSAGYAGLAATPLSDPAAGAPIFAARLGELPTRAIVAHAWLDGELLRGNYCMPDWHPDAVIRTGIALAHLHSGAAVGLPRRDIEADFAAIDASRRGLLWLTPHLASLANRLAERLAAQLAQRSAAWVPIHGDFYGKQVLDTASGIAFLDLDELCQGHPAADLGLFVAHLELEARYAMLPQERVAAVTEALLQGYQAAGGQIEAVDLKIHTALGLYLLAHHPFRSAASDWPNRIEMLLEDCARYLDAAAALGCTDSRPASGIPHLDPAMPQLEEILDPTRAGNVLFDHLRLAGVDLGSAVLENCRLLRHKPGRRCLIEFTWTNRGGNTHVMLGKIRAKGLDPRTFAAMRALSASGFSGDAPDAVDVPAALAMVPRYGLWLQARVPGVPAWSALHGARGSEWGTRIAEGIHRLHACGYCSDRTHGLDDELTILTRRLDLAAEARPTLRDRISAVKSACLALASQMPAINPTCIHRDFYPDQVLVDQERLHLLDFDLLCMGDPAIDVGNFIAHLIEQGLRVHGHPDAYAPAISALRQRYATLAEHPGMTVAIDAHTRLSLARHIQISTTLPDRINFTPRILAVCEAMFEIPVPASQEELF